MCAAVRTHRSGSSARSSAPLPPCPCVCIKDGGIGYEKKPGGRGERSGHKKGSTERERSRGSIVSTRSAPFRELYTRAERTLTNRQQQPRRRLDRAVAAGAVSLYILARGRRRSREERSRRKRRTGGEPSACYNRPRVCNVGIGAPRGPVSQRAVPAAAAACVCVCPGDRWCSDERAEAAAAATTAPRGCQ